jgi:NAD(P)-dependent dehydrogenase (short-subunit alcohol dehydrogenase family)
MKVVLSDIDESSLYQTENEIKERGASTLAVLTDVSKASDVEALAQMTLDKFKAVHLLFNNAGVIVGGATWTNTLADWEWVLGVNLWGVIHGVRFFVPTMLKQGHECHVVNTASMAGLMSTPFNSAPYSVSKHGVIALSETLYHHLSQIGSKIGVSVLCPDWVNTQVMEGERNRPVELCNDPEFDRKLKAHPAYQKMWGYACEQIKSGISVQQAADCVFDAIRNNKFYIITHQDAMYTAKSRAEDIIQQRNPTNVMPMPES